MDEVVFTKGQKVSYTEKDVTYSGVVESHRSGWVMVELDDGVDTGHWRAKRTMVRDSKVKPAA